jgi:hypothetical protein
MILRLMVLWLQFGCHINFIEVKISPIVELIHFNSTRPRRDGKLSIWWIQEGRKTVNKKAPTSRGTFHLPPL